MPPKRTTSSSSKKNKNAATPLDAAQRKIAEEEAKVRAEMEKYQRLIEQAPKRAAEAKQRLETQKRIQREEAVVRRSKIEGRFGSLAALPDRRYELNAGAPARQRRLRAERNRGRFMFFILLLVFAGTVAFLWVTMTHGR